MTATITQERAPTFLEQIISATPGECHLANCIQCGTCGGSCPSGADMDHTPRALFALAAAGMKEDVLKSNTPWYCVSCYYCTVRCPRDIHVTDVMYSIKRIAVEEGVFDNTTAPDFSKTFINLVENFGRSFELGLMSLHIIKHTRLKVFKITDMGLGLVTKNRLAFAPTRIKGMKSLKAILAKAKELEAAA